MYYNLFNILKDDAAAATETANTSLLSSFSFITVLMLFASIYVLWAGIKGSGKLYDTSFVKEGMEEAYCKLLRKAYLILGALMLINSAFSVAEGYFYPSGAETAVHELGVFSFYTLKTARIINYVSWGVLLAGFALMIILMRKYTDRDAAAKRAQQAEEERKKDPQYGHTLPVSAFEFGEETESTDPEKDECEEDPVSGDGEV